VSRLDPLREGQEFLDALEAEREHRLEPFATPSGRERTHSLPDGPSREQPDRIASARVEVRFENTREVLYDRDRGYRLRESEIRTLVDLGRFRIVGREELRVHGYAGRPEEMEGDLRNLLRQGLIGKGSFEGPEQTPRELLTLTRRGHLLLRVNRIVPEGQAIYYGFAKPRDANHDADLYTMYQNEIVRIRKEGGHSPRVILDFELKRKINRDIVKFGREARPEIARSHGLRVIRGRVPVPDVRIEYEKPDGELARVDLELVSEHYRGRSLGDKVKAGFSLYTPRGEADRLRRALAGQELIAEILSL
jgi:hypothetical protein